MDANIIELAKTFPNLTVSIGINDLIEAVEFSVSHTRKSLEQMIQDESEEKYLSPKKAAELLECDPSTLHRWRVKGYLAPIEIGGKRRYKLSDIKRIMEG